MSRELELFRLCVFLLFVVSALLHLTPYLDQNLNDGEKVLLGVWQLLDDERLWVGPFMDMAMPFLLFLCLASAFFYLWITPYMLFAYLALCVPWSAFSGIGIYMPLDGALSAIHSLLLSIVFALSWLGPEVRLKMKATAPSWAGGPFQ